MYNDGSNSGNSSPSLSNVILWGNSASSRGHQLFNQYTSLTLSYTLIQSGTKDIYNNNSTVTYGSGIFTDDPLFVAPITATVAPTSSGNTKPST